jgi:xanthine dehydrogenase accessory factor
MEPRGDFKLSIVLIRGAGEKASAVAHLLHRIGLKKIVMTDLPVPLAERRGVSFCEAIADGRKEVSGVLAHRTEPSLSLIHEIWADGRIAVLADPETRILSQLSTDILIDGVMAKRNTGTSIRDAPLVIALGPGFVAGQDAHAVVETNPASPQLGRVISEGGAEEDTDTPTPVLGLTTERLIRAPADGMLSLIRNIGDKIAQDETLGYVGSRHIKANISGCVWGVVRNGVEVKEGQKIGDIDPRKERDLCFEITPQAKVIAEGALKAITRFCRKCDP